MPSEIKEFFNSAKAQTPKAACAEYAYKLFDGSKRVADIFNSQYNKIYLIDNHHSLIKKCNICVYW